MIKYSIRSHLVNIIVPGFFLYAVTISTAMAGPYSSKVVGMKFAEVPFPGDFQMSVLNIQKPGGEVVVLVRSKGKKIIAVDKDKTNKDIQAWKSGDNGSKQLLNGGEVSAGFFSKISKDSMASLVTLKCEVMPDNVIKSIHAKGYIHILTADSRVEVTNKKFDLKPGQILRIGSVQMKFRKSGKPQWGKQPMEITFDTDEKLEYLSEIRFYQLNGKEIKSSRGSTMSIDMGGLKQVSVSYKLGKKVDKVMVKAKYWKGLQPVKVPFSFDVKRMF
ncbi:MAG TPA: hypothetical protein ENI65_00620 [Gammaproteobacteria bacterium]|nr:hypothetical protein [Gammaproteobacteria bacterium]